MSGIIARDSRSCNAGGGRTALAAQCDAIQVNQSAPRRLADRPGGCFRSKLTNAQSHVFALHDGNARESMAHRLKLVSATPTMAIGGNCYHG